MPESKRDVLNSRPNNPPPLLHRSKLLPTDASSVGAPPVLNQSSVPQESATPDTFSSGPPPVLNRRSVPQASEPADTSSRGPPPVLNRSSVPRSSKITGTSVCGPPPVLNRSSVPQASEPTQFTSSYSAPPPVHFPPSTIPTGINAAPEMKRTTGSDAHAQPPMLQRQGATTEHPSVPSPIPQAFNPPLVLNRATGRIAPALPPMLQRQGLTTAAQPPKIPHPSEPPAVLDGNDPGPVPVTPPTNNWPGPPPILGRRDVSTPPPLLSRSSTRDAHKMVHTVQNRHPVTNKPLPPHSPIQRSPPGLSHVKYTREPPSGAPLAPTPAATDKMLDPPPTLLRAVPVEIAPGHPQSVIPESTRHPIGPTAVPGVNLTPAPPPKLSRQPARFTTPSSNIKTLDAPPKLTRQSAFSLSVSNRDIPQQVPASPSVPRPSAFSPNLPGTPHIRRPREPQPFIVNDSPAPKASATAEGPEATQQHVPILSPDHDLLYNAHAISGLDGSEYHPELGDEFYLSGPHAPTGFMLATNHRERAVRAQKLLDLMMEENPETNKHGIDCLPDGVPYPPVSTITQEEINLAHQEVLEHNGRMPYYASTQSIYRNLRPRLKDSLALVKSLESLAEDLEASADNLYDEILEEDHRD